MAMVNNKRAAMVTGLAVVAIAAVCSDVAAAHGVHRMHVSHHHGHRRMVVVQYVPDAISPSAGQSPIRMRYYGGPKSPMWAAQ